MEKKRFSFIILGIYILSLILLIIGISISYRLLKKNGLYDHYILGDAMESRNYKTNYINDNLQYEGFIIGGSKAGGLKTNQINEYLGYPVYNFHNPYGSFLDYDEYVDYLLNRYDGNVKSIILHVSTHEFENKSKVDSLPLLMIDSKLERFSKTISNGIEKYTNISRFIENYNMIRGVGGRSSLNNDGSRNYNDAYGNYLLDENLYIKKYVLDSWLPHELSLKKLFSDENVDIKYKDFSIEMLKDIKKNCENHGCKLVVIWGPTFINELYKYKSPEFYNYLREFVAITPVYNFSGINNVDLNPHNFVNGGHYWSFIGDLMIDEVFSGEMPNTIDMDKFGILLTPDNIETYIQDQTKKYYSLREEYEKTGTIQLIDYEY